MEKKALLVIDMQNDHLWDKRKDKFSYPTDELVSAVNCVIDECREAAYDILYIGQVFPDIISNRRLIGFSIRGTEGAALYSKLKVVSDYYFEKGLPDAYTSKPFRQHMKRQNYTRVLLCGLDECGCVAATAESAVKTGARVLVLENCIGCRFPLKRSEKTRVHLKSLGVRYGYFSDNIVDRSSPG
ncbi:MAG: cysteine hydrolase [Oscillospiraceae bacterium]|nr:cysteine hydrolase [Oscillospiraceae bacterium]